VPEAPYRAPLPIPPDPYLIAWRDLRRRRVIGWTAFVGGPPLFLLLLAFLLHVQMAIHDATYCDPGACVPPREVPPLLLLEAEVAVRALWLPPVVWVAACLYRWHFRCPHCGLRYATGWRACGGCRIRIGTPKSAVVEAEKSAGAAGAGA
jgi:hypothetical protein